MLGVLLPHGCVNLPGLQQLRSISGVTFNSDDAKEASVSHLLTGAHDKSIYQFI